MSIKLMNHLKMIVGILFILLLAMPVTAITSWSSNTSNSFANTSMDDQSMITSGLIYPGRPEVYIGGYDLTTTNDVPGGYTAFNFNKRNFGISGNITTYRGKYGNAPGGGYLIVYNYSGSTLTYKNSTYITTTYNTVITTLQLPMLYGEVLAVSGSYPGQQGRTNNGEGMYYKSGAVTSTTNIGTWSYESTDDMCYEAYGQYLNASNSTTSYNFGLGNELYQIVINATTLYSNNYYNISYRSHNNGEYTLLAGNLKNDTSTVISGIKYDFTDILITKYGDLTNLTTISNITLYSQESGNSTIPPDPINLGYISGGKYWINYSWESGLGNVTDGYYVLYNNQYYNRTTTNLNVSFLPGYNNYSNITVWAYNTSGIGSTQSNEISNNTLLNYPNKYYVRVDGNNANNGLTNNAEGAWLTIQKATSTLDQYEIGEIQSGTYSENNITFSNSNVTLIANGSVTINSTDMIFNIDKNYININGFNITSITTKIDETYNTTLVPAIKITANNSIIHNNTIRVPNTGGQQFQLGGYTPGIYVSSGSNNNISNNYIHTGNVRSSAIWLYGSSTNNIITNNSLNSTQYYEIGFGSDRDTYTPTGVFNNTILNNTAYQGNKIYYIQGEQNTIYDFNYEHLGQLIIVNSINVTVKNMLFINNSGIFLYNTTYSNITNMSYLQVDGGGGSRYSLPKYNSHPAIPMWYSDYNSFNNITINSGGRGNDGIKMYAYCDYNSINNYSWTTSGRSSAQPSLESHNTGIPLDWYDTYNTFTNVILLDSSYSSYPITSGGNSNYNTFENLYSYRYGNGVDQGWILRSKYNTFKNITAIVNLPYGNGGMTVAGVGNIFYNSIINNTQSQNHWGIGSYGTEDTEVSLINVNINDYLGAASNQIYHTYYYLDVNVAYANGTPANNAIVNITNEVNNSVTSTSYNLASKTSFYTDASGHTKLPNTANASTSPLIKENRRSNVFESYTYNISASDGTNTAYVANVSPNLTWYRSKPLVPTYTVNVVLINPPSFDGDASLFWVRTDGNNSCNGQNNMSYGTNGDQNLTDCAWQTVTKAATTLQAGQSVRVQDGEYLSQSFTVSNSSTSFYADGNVHLNSGITFTGKQYVRIDGFNLTGSQIYATDGAVHPDYAIITNNTISNYPGGYGGIQLKYSDNSIISYNTVDNVEKYGIALTGGVTYNIPINNATIINNIIKHSIPYGTMDYGFKFDVLQNSYSANNIASSSTHNWRLRHSINNNIFENETSYNAMNFNLEIDGDSSESNNNNTFRNWTIDGENLGYSSPGLSYAGIKLASNSDNNTFENFSITNIKRSLTSAGILALASYSSENTCGYNTLANEATGSCYGSYTYRNYESNNNIFNNITISNSYSGIYLYSPDNTFKNIIFSNNTYDFNERIGINEIITDTINNTYRIKINSANTSNSMIINYTDNRNFKWKYDTVGTWNYVVGTVTITSPTGDITVTTLDAIPPAVNFMPPIPIDCSHTNSTTWINISCSAGDGNITDELRFELVPDVWLYSFNANFTGLIQNTIYDFNIYAYNNSGNGSISSAVQISYSTQTSIPPTPINCITTNYTTSINISCSAGIGNITNGMNFTNGTIWSNSTDFYWVNTNLASGTTYTYNIYAYNNPGELNLTYATVQGRTLIESSIQCLYWCFLTSNTSQTLLQIDNNQSNDTIQTKYNSTSKKYESHVTGYSPNQNSTVSNKEGYASYFTSLTYINTTYLSNPSIDIKSGWNLLGNLESSRSLSTLKASITNATLASHWNNTQHIWITDNSEIVNIGESFMVYTTSNSTWSN